MKRIVVTLLLILSITLRLSAQGGILLAPKDTNGFNIQAYNIKTKVDSTLYLSEYIYINEYLPISTAILTSIYKYDSNKLNFNMFSDEYYKTKDIYQYKMFCIVYNEEVMILKVKKNRTHFSIRILNLIFQEGIFEIDLDKIYQKYKKKSEYGVTIPQFPLEE